MTSSLRAFINSSSQERALLLQAFLYLMVWRSVVLALPLSWWSRRLGELGGEPAAVGAESMAEVALVSQAVARLSPKVPWDANCLNRALAARSLLKRRRIPSTLYLGVRHTEGGRGLEAHAWLVVGDQTVTGGGEKDSFREISRYAWRPL